VHDGEHVVLATSVTCLKMEEFCARITFAQPA